MDHNRNTERQLGLIWESKFGQMIVPYGFSAQKTVPKGMDRMVWDANGEIVHIQVRHKNPFNWAGIGECFGYERYRLDNDMQIVKRGGVVLYVIHDYTRHGRLSPVNDAEDWVAQYTGHLAASIDLERNGPTWFGDYTEKQIMPICYWHRDKFEPIGYILEDLRNRLGLEKEG